MYCSNFLAYLESATKTPSLNQQFPAVAAVSKFAVNPPPTEAVDISDQAARRVHLTGFLTKAPDPGAIWVFAAGSLMWRPGFNPAEARNGTLAWLFPPL